MMGLRLQGQYVPQSFVMPQRFSPLGQDPEKIYFYPTTGAGARPQPGELLAGSFIRQAVPYYRGELRGIADDIGGFLEQYKWPLLLAAGALLWFSGKKRRARKAA